MSEEIIKVLDELSKRFGVAIDWTSENAIPYLEQLAKKFVNYEIATSIFWIAFFMILFVVTLIVAVKLTKMAIKDEWVNEFPGVPAVITVILSIVFGIIAIITLGEQGMDIATCLTFPEKEILEYVKTLM